MCQKLLGDATLYAVLRRIDEDMAAEVRAGRCPFCGGPLHQANYPRKPRGGPEDLDEGCPPYPPRFSASRLPQGGMRRGPAAKAAGGPLCMMSHLQLHLASRLRGGS